MEIVHAFMEHLPDVAWVKDDEFRYRYVNPAHTALFNVSATDILGREDDAFMRKETAEELRERDQLVLSSGDAINSIEDVAGADGIMRRWSVQRFPIPRPGGKTWIAGRARDITESLQAGDELWQGKKNNRLLKETQAVGRFGSWSMDLADRKRVIWSAETCRIFGQDPDEFDGRIESLLKLVDPRDRDQFPEFPRNPEHDPGAYDIEFRVQVDGRTRWIREQANVEHDANDKPVRLIGIVQDVTERRIAQEKMRISEERYRLVALASGDPIWEIDITTGQVSWNETYNRMFGIRPEETGGSWDWWTNRIREDEREAVADSLSNTLADPHADHWSMDYHFRGANGEELLIQDRAFISRDEDGKPLRIVGTMRDQTPAERAMQEREELIRDVQEAQRLESLGVLAGGIAHDFNNLLASILGNVSLTRARLGAASEEGEILGEAEDAVRRAADLCYQMLTYAGEGRFVLKGLNLSSEIGKMVNLLRVSLGKNARMQLKLDPDLPIFQGDQAQISQVALNLVINASEAIGENDGEITVTTGRSRFVVEPPDVAIVAPQMPGVDCAFLEVADTGSGMDEATCARIFEPSFTTKFAGRGLGLAAVQGIVRGHQGGLTVRSEVGVGTRFRIFLPLAPDPDSKVAEESGDASSLSIQPGNRDRAILVIEDDDSVRESTVRVLELSGYKVSSAGDGEKGVDCYRADPESVDLVLLDLTMPRMDGLATFQALRELEADLPILLMSGHSKHSSLERFEGLSISGFIQKPFDLAELTSMIEKILSAQGGA